MSYKLITAAFSLLVASGCHSSASDDRKQATKRADGAPIFRSKFGDCDERVSPSANMKPNLGGFPIVSSIDVSNQYVGLIGELSYSETVKRGLDWDKDGFLENKINAERYFDRTDLLEDFSIDKRAISLQDAFVIVSSRPAPCPGEGGVCAKPDLEGGYLMTGLSTFGSAATQVAEGEPVAIQFVFKNKNDYQMFFDERIEADFDAIVFYPKNAERQLDMAALGVWSIVSPINQRSEKFWVFDSDRTISDFRSDELGVKRHARMLFCSIG